MTPANGAPAPAAEAGPQEVESEADAFRRQVDDLVSKTDVVILRLPAPGPVSYSDDDAILVREKRRLECFVWRIWGNLCSCLLERQFGRSSSQIGVVCDVCAAAGEARERGGGLLRWQEARKRRAEGRRWRQARGILEGDARPYAPVRRAFERGDLSRVGS